MDSVEKGTVNEKKQCVNYSAVFQRGNITTELRDQMARDLVDYSAQSPQVFLRHAWHKRTKMDHAVTQEISWENSRAQCCPYIVYRSFFSDKTRLYRSYFGSNSATFRHQVFSLANQTLLVRRQLTKSE